MFSGARKRKRKAGFMPIKTTTKAKKARLNVSDDKPPSELKRFTGKVVKVKFGSRDLLWVQPDDGSGQGKLVSILKGAVRTGGVEIMRHDKISYLPSSKKPKWGCEAKLEWIEKRSDEIVDLYLSQEKETLINAIQICPELWIYLCQRHRMKEKTFFLLLQTVVGLPNLKRSSHLSGPVDYVLETLTQSPDFLKRLRDFLQSKQVHENQSLVRKFFTVVAAEAPEKFYRLFPAVKDFCPLLRADSSHLAVNHSSASLQISPQWSHSLEPPSCEPTSLIPAHILTTDQAESPAHSSTIHTPSGSPQPEVEDEVIPAKCTSPSSDDLDLPQLLVSAVEQNHQLEIQNSFAVELVKLLAFGAAGKSGDIKALAWNRIPQLPLVSELNTEVNIDILSAQLPSVKFGVPYLSLDEYLGTYFQLLREDCYYHLRYSIQEFCQGRLDPGDMAMYKVALSGLQINKSGVNLCLTLQMLQRKKINLRNSKLLMRDNLVCISIGGDFRKVIWAVISGRDEEMLKKGCIFVTPVPRNENIGNIITDLRKCSLDDKTGDVALMAESPTYYRAFQPVLECLQNKKGSIPFQTELVDLVSQTEVPQYLAKASAAFGLLFTNYTDRSCSDSHSAKDKRFTHLQEESAGSTVSISEAGLLHGHLATVAEQFADLLKTESTSILDESQQKAFKHCLENRLAIVQGPPGTGKSFVGTKLAEFLLSVRPEVSGPIMVLTYKNHALDNFLEGCLPFCEDLIRIGGRSRSGDLQRFNLAEKMKEFKKGYSNTAESKYNLLTAMTRLLQQSRSFSLLDFQKRISWIQMEKFCKNACSSCRSLPLIRKIEEEKQSDQFHESNSKGNIFRDFSQEIWKMLYAWMPSKHHFESLRSSHQINLSLKSYIERFLLGNARSTKKDNAFDDEIDEVLDERLSHTEKSNFWGNHEKGFIELKQDTSLPELKMEIPEVQVHVDKFEKATLQATDDLWLLKLPERARLVCCWREENMRDYSIECQQLTSRFNCEIDKEITGDNMFSDFLCHQVKIIGLTTTGAAINSSLIERISPSVVIVEEAAEILEAQLIAVLPTSVEHLIMLGDHKQLRPQIQCHKLGRRNKLHVSMFERLIEGGIPFVQLEYQCRMREEFVDTFRHLYPDLKTNKQLVEHNEPPQCIRSSMFFWTHSNPESRSSSVFSKSLMNTEEITEILSVLRLLLHENYDPEKITVLATYQEQLREIRAALKDEDMKNVVTSTVDRYQGKENDILLVSLVRSNELSKIGFLADERRMCVAASRARCGLYFFGNANMLATRSPFWKNLIAVFERMRHIGSEFPLYCPRHPSKKMTVNRCIEKCFQAMSCGHLCYSLCHPEGQHEKCKKVVACECMDCHLTNMRPCHKLEQLHKCKNEVTDICNNCKEETKRLCHETPASCPFPCKKRLSCRHDCQNFCSEPCTEICKFCERQKEQNMKIASKKIKELAKSHLKRIEESADTLYSLQKPDGKMESYQSELERFLPPWNGKKVRVISAEKAVNTNLERKWWHFQRTAALSTEPNIFYVLLSESLLHKVLAKGAVELPKKMREWKETLKNGILACNQSESRLVALRFKVMKGRCKRCLSSEAAKEFLLKKENKCDSVCWLTEDEEEEALFLRCPYLALPDSVIHFEVVSDKSFLSGISVEPDFYEMRTFEKKEEYSERHEDDLLFREAESQFLRNVPAGSSYCVTKVELVNNGRLNKAFDETKNHFLKVGKDSKETFAFHGTADDTFEKIFREGFKVGGKEVEIRHGSVYGQGIYTAKNPKTSMSYSKSKKLILARVVKGQKGEDYREGENPEIYVLASSSQIVPQYVVHYEPR